MADNKLTMEDLYGPQAHSEKQTIKDGLVYEETPEIVPLDETVTEVPVHLPEQKGTVDTFLTDQSSFTPHISPKHSLPSSEHLSNVQMNKKKMSIWLKSVLFLVIFGIGLGVSLIVRPYLARLMSQFSQAEDTSENTVQTPTDTPRDVALTPQGDIAKNSSDSFSSPTPIPVSLSVSGDYPYNLFDEQKQFVGVTIVVPVSTKPLCDTPACSSQGTNLPGGSRFTVAAYTKGPYITDITRAKIVDASGQLFTSEVASISGKPAVRYEGNFRGTTSGGYTFSQMHGVMVRIKDTLTVELNYFVPIGVSADFAGDAKVFEGIVGSLKF